MCGIAGMLSKEKDMRARRDVTQRISESLRMRGPDASGEFCRPYISLIHRRLSVIDPEKGAQPMRFGDYVIVYNGEIYNTQEVRDELIALGYCFETHCDTEVVLKAYHQWKEKSAQKLNGIFAYAVWDDEKKELFLCRDRIGVKPLYYAVKDGVFAFASRIKSLLEVPEITTQVDGEGLREIFLLGPAKPNGRAVFRDIRELPSASYMTVSEKGVKIRQYWFLKAEPHTESFEETVAHTHDLVTDAITRQLVSDVPLCTFLSGGLDSSIISEIAARHYRENGRTLDTFSVDYTDNDKFFKASIFQPNKDSDYISLMSDAIGSHHRNVVLDNRDVARAVIESTIAKGVPGFTDVDSSLLLFCREVKKSNTVALSGECADEIFGGYPWYHNKDILFEETFPWSRSVGIRTGIAREGLFPDAEEYVHAQYEQTVRDTSYLDSDSGLERRMREMFRLNLDWFMQTLLTRKDCMSMESSLEVRVPFCDYRIVEYAYNMPWEFKSYEGREKGILRKAFEKELPEVIAWRKKSPYPKTYHPIFLQEIIRLTREALDDRTSPLQELINRQRIEELIRNPDSLCEPWYGQLMKGPQVLAYIVQIYWWIRDNHVEFI